MRWHCAWSVLEHIVGSHLVHISRNFLENFEVMCRYFSLLINTAGSHTACGFLITPTAPLNRDNLQHRKKFSATRSYAAKRYEIQRLSTSITSAQQLNKKREKIELTTRIRTKVSIAKSSLSCQGGMQVSI